MTLKGTWYNIPMNLPNLLTCSRFVLTVIFAALMPMTGAGAAWTALLVFVIAALTDLADGYIARKYSLVTTFGQIMDPLADKALILTAFFIFACEGIVPLWMVGLVAGREILVTLVRFQALITGKVLPAESAGKIKAVVQMTVAVLALLYRVGITGGMAPGFALEHQSLLVFLISAGMAAVVGLTLWSGGAFFRNLFLQR